MELGALKSAGRVETVQSFASESADIFHNKNRAAAGGSTLEEFYPVAADATVDAFLRTPTIRDLQKMSDDAKATHKIIFPDPTVNILKDDKVVISTVAYIVESVEVPSTPSPYKAAFAYEMQPGRGNE